MRFVTSNQHKFNEIREALAKYGIETEWMKMKYEEIQADSTAEISLDSAKKLSTAIGEDFFLEDTGLYIKALHGFPGPYSSYVSTTVGNSGILRLIEGRTREAEFVTILTYKGHDQLVQFEGVLRGQIAYKEAGEGGFGFDPIFIPEGQDRTLAEMSISEKNEISHRSQAVGKFANYIIKKA